MTQPLIVAAAIIRKNDRVLITRRPEGSRDPGKWEFPGGKLDAGESPEECLKRELIEELDLPVRVEKIFQVHYHQYNWGPVLLLFYECSPLANDIKNIEVAEHKYILVSELPQYDLLEADQPIIAELMAT